MSDKRKEYSTSALAKKLGKSSRQMFAELEALGWIRRENEQWQLTTKGEFEQGHYRDSDRFGRYIVWPATILTHRALVSPEDKLTSAKGLGLKTDLPATRINQLLAELGWIKPWLRGWQVTEAGLVAGGLQREDERSAIPYVVWPKALVDHPVFARALKAIKCRLGPISQYSGCSAMDGHVLRSEAEVMIDNWLYLAGIVHACHRQLPIETQASADFYLPQAQLFIEYWGVDNDPGYLAEKMRRKELYQQFDLNLIELKEEDVKQLDEVLPKALRRFGVEC